MHYLISYDLDSDNHQSVDAKLCSMGADRILASQWVLSRDDTSADKLLDELLSDVFDKKDSLVVNSLYPDSKNLAYHTPLKGTSAVARIIHLLRTAKGNDQ